MKIYHILNGDCLAEKLKATPFSGNNIVFREALLEGPVRGVVLEEFLNSRAQYFAAEHSVPCELYMEKSGMEIYKLLSIPEDAEVNLWFGNDLFCQVNMWFILALFGESQTRTYYRIFPPDTDEFGICNGFVLSDQTLLNDKYLSRVKFETKDLMISTELWRAYQDNDFFKLREIAKGDSSCFCYLKEVVEAHIGRFETDGKPGRPELVLSELSRKHSGDFNLIFAEFVTREPLYGFSDLHVKSILSRIKWIPL